MAESDPLELFRATIAASATPSLLDAAQQPTANLADAVSISFAIPSLGAPTITSKTASTRYTTSSGAGEYYNIGQIWLAWVERESGVREYLIKGQAGGVGYVGIADRRGVVEYLSGSTGGERVVPISTSGSGDAVPGDESATAEKSSAEAVTAALETMAQAGPSSKAPAVATGKRAYEVDKEDLEFCRKLRTEEIELRDRNTVLRSSGGGKVNNFDFVLRGGLAERIRAFRKQLEAPVAGSKGANASASQAAFDPSRGAKKAKHSNPIIIISSSPTSLITMWNVKKFLEQGVFELSEVARQNEAAQGNIRAEDMVPVIRKRTGPAGDVTSKYYVVDGVEALQKFGQDAWYIQVCHFDFSSYKLMRRDRVICVVTTGQAWQFKPYKWQEPRTLFRNVKGIYFQWHNEPTNPVVREWNISEMRLDRNKRHIDRQVVAEFWRILDSGKRR